MSVGGASVVPSSHPPALTHYTHTVHRGIPFWLGDFGDPAFEAYDLPQTEIICNPTKWVLVG